MAKLSRRSRNILIALLLAVVIATGFWRLRFDLEVLNLMPADLPAAKGIRLYQQNFDNARELIITVQAEDAELCETATQLISRRLQAESNLVADVMWQPPWLQNPQATTEFLAFCWLNQSPEVFERLVADLTGSNLLAHVAESREVLRTSLSPETLARRSYDPLSFTELLGNQDMGDASALFSSSDGTFRVIFSKAAFDIGNYRKCTQWLTAVRSVVAQAQRELPQDRIRVRFTGQPAFVSEISSGMQRDLAGPSGLTLLVIAGLFYWTHRRFKPLLWLVALLLLCLALTCAIGGFLFGSLNVVSFGFASILLGLAEDFGIVVYQECRTHPTFNMASIRALAAPGVFWSAFTTCSAFLLLNFGGLPGLRQLGTLVAIGVAVAALLMLYLYLPLVIDDDSGNAPAESVRPSQGSGRFALFCTVALILVSAGILWGKQPHLNASPDALGPRTSEAYDAAAEMKARLSRSQDPVWVVVAGSTESQVLERLRTAERELTEKLPPNFAASITIPTAVWPDPEAQRTNASKAELLVSRRQELRNAVMQGGFAPEAFTLADRILNTWSNAIQLNAVFWPTNDASRWILGRFTARNGSDLFALGLINRLPGNNKSTTNRELIALSEHLTQQGINISGWDLLGAAVLKRVQERFWKVVIPMVLLIVGSLWLAFRSLREVLLSSAIMLASALFLCALMALLGWSWNLLNLMSIPLLLGMGVDFSIHMQLALGRYHGDWGQVRQSMGRAILLAGSTTVAGFGSLALSNNAGVASLGKVCASGILIAMLLSVYLLPHWWVWTKQRKSSSIG